jgi:hypothetical protein
MARVVAVTKDADLERKLTSLRESQALFGGDDTLTIAIQGKIEALSAERASSAVRALHEIVALAIEAATAGLTAEDRER